MLLFYIFVTIDCFSLGFLTDIHPISQISCIKNSFLNKLGLAWQAYKLKRKLSSMNKKRQKLQKRIDGLKKDADKQTEKFESIKRPAF